MSNEEMTLGEFIMCDEEENGPLPPSITRIYSRMKEDNRGAPRLTNDEWDELFKLYEEHE